MKTGGRHRVPVVMQMEATECGAASLTMVMAYYGLWLPLSQVRYECGVSRDGSNLKNVARAARERGMNVKAFSVEPEDLKEVVLPAIAHWEFQHFVVVTGVSGKKVYINDPAQGRISMSLEEAGKHLTGVVLQLVPSDDFQKGGEKPSIAGFVAKRLRGAGEALMFTFLTGLVMAAAGIVVPILYQIFMDDIITGRNSQWFPLFLILFGLVTVVKFLAMLLQCIYSRAFRMKLSITGNTSFLQHLLRLPMRFFWQHSTGDLIMRQESSSSVASRLVEKLAPLVINVVLLFIYLIYMIRYNTVLAGVAVLVSLLNLVIVRIVADRQADMMRVVARNEGKLMSATMSGMFNIESVKAAGAEDAFFNRWAGEYAACHNSKVRMNTTVAYIGSLPKLLTDISNTVVLGIGVWYILHGGMTVGMLMAFQSLMGLFLDVSSGANDTFGEMLGMKSDMERMEDVFNSETDAAVTGQSENAADMDGKLDGRLELKNVTFGYSRLAEPVIKDFSLVIEPGRSVALVGGTGSGKSTIGKIIAGVNQPWSGDVLYDGLHQSEISRQTFVNSVALIDQDHVIFQGTVADNVKMWDSSIEDFAMIMACDQAQLHEDIMARAGAYDSPVNDNGSNFSGGQCQRIEAAAALVREPVILVMDEATSALDTKTEEALMSSVRATGTTLVIVAHRLSTIRDCDEIIVLDHGRVAERGTHDELMKSRGYYFDLMNADNGTPE